MHIFSNPRVAVAHPVGTIAEVHGPVVDLSCEVLPPLHQALVTSIDHETYTFEVHQHLDRRRVRAITLHRTTGLQRGMPVFDTGAPLRVPVAPDCLGRLLNLFGEPLDGGPPLTSGAFRNILARPLPLHESKGASGVLETGIKVIDLLVLSSRAARLGSLAVPESAKRCTSWNSCTPSYIAPRYVGIRRRR